VNTLRDGPAMLWLAGNGAQDEHVERTLQQVGGWRHWLPLTIDRAYFASCRMSRGRVCLAGMAAELRDVAGDDA